MNNNLPRKHIRDTRKGFNMDEIFLNKEQIFTELERELTNTEEKHNFKQAYREYESEYTLNLKQKQTGHMHINYEDIRLIRMHIYQ